MAFHSGEKHGDELLLFVLSVLHFDCFAKMFEKDG